MKRMKRLPIFLMFVTLLTLLFTGCTGNVKLDGDNSILPQGSNIEINYDNNFNFEINDSSKTVEDESDADEDEDDASVEEDSDSEDSNSGRGSEDSDSESGSDESDSGRGTDESADSGRGSDDVSDNKDNADTADKNAADNDSAAGASDELTVTEDGEYTSKDEVALYIHTFGHLPSNYITKKEAQDLGWDSSQGNLNKVAPGKSIGGDKFGNREGLLPKKSGRQYYECDIDYKKGKRNGKRIVFSNDGLVYYTDDHYESYTLLYE